MTEYNPFTNLSYDKCELEKKEQENKSHFNWTVDPTFAESKSACFNQNSPFSRNPSFAVPSSNVLIESDLRGQTRPLSRCPKLKFMPDLNENKKLENLNECQDKFLEPQYTRINRPCNVLSEVSINRFEHLCEDHQSLNKISDNSFIGSNTRLQIRDAFAKQNNRKI